MPYIGNEPPQIAAYGYESFDGGGTSFTLSKTATTASVLLFIDGVRQTPIDAFSVSGTTLTTTASTPSGTDNVTVQFLGDVVDLGVPSDGTVGQTQLGLATGDCYQNPNTISSTITTTVASTNNGVMFGPITVNSGVTWTISGTLSIL